MKFPLFFITALTVASLSVARADNYSAKESFSRTSPFNANAEVSLENVNGDVDVHVWDKNEILIEGEKSAKTDEELKLIDLKIDLSPSQANVVVKLPKRPGSFMSGNSIRAAVRFRLTVPASAVLKKVSVVNSTVTIENVRGPVNASSVNGGVHADGLGGNARLETVNGPIKAQFETLAALQSLSLKTVNGRVVVGLPKDAGFQLESSVVNGSVNCDFPIESTQKKQRKNLSGKVGDGRASLNVSTVNGSIHIEKH